MDTSSTQAQEAVKLFQVTVDQLHNIRAQRPKSHAIKQWYGSITSSVKKPFRSLRAKLRPINLNNDLETSNVEWSSLLQTLQAGSVYTVQPYVDPPTNAPTNAPTKTTPPTTRNLQNATSRMQFERQDSHATWQPMSGAYPMVRPSRPQSLPPTSTSTSRHTVGANRYGSVRMWSSIQLDTRPRKSWCTYPHEQIYSAASSENPHSSASQIRRWSRSTAWDHTMFTQAELDEAVARIPLPSPFPATSPPVLEPRCDSGNGDVRGGLLREVDEAAEEWAGNGTELMDGYQEAEKGASVHHDAEEDLFYSVGERGYRSDGERDEGDEEEEEGRRRWSFQCHGHTGRN